MAYKSEQQKRMIAALTTVGVNAIILLILLFVAAWKSPGSGPGDYPGIEINLGYDDQGTGDIEPHTPIGQEDANDIENPPAEEKQQEVETPPQEVESNSKPIESGTLTDPNSDVEIKEQVKEEKKEEKPPLKTPEKTTEIKPVEKTEKVVEKPVQEKPREADTKALYKKPATNTTTTGNGDGTKGTPGNQGDDLNKEGNKGQPDGVEGAATYKGTAGGGTGAGLVIDGWNWDEIPKVVPPESEEPGQVVYQIEVDESGEVVTIRKESGTVSNEFDLRCRKAIRELSFTKKPNAKVPELTKGRITFVVRAK